MFKTTVSCCKQLELGLEILMETALSISESTLIHVLKSRHVLKFSRLVFGLVCSPIILNVTLRNHLLKYENIVPEFVRDVIRTLYVDGFASGKNTERLF